MTVAGSSDRSDSPALLLLDRVHIAPLVAWLEAIPWADWPVQNDGRPAMVNDPAWHDLALVTAGIRYDVMTAHFAHCRDANVMLSAVMPGADIPPHADRQAPEWVTRVHVPIVSNPSSAFVIAGQDYRLAPGLAYAIDIRRTHAVVNAGDVPRVHLMWDVLLA